MTALIASPHACEERERRVDVVCRLDRCASAPQRVVTLSLHGAELAAGRLVFDEQRLTGARRVTARSRRRCLPPS